MCFAFFNMDTLVEKFLDQGTIGPTRKMSSDSVQNFMDKSSLDNNHENTILKRRRIKSEEETFIM